VSVENYFKASPGVTQYLTDVKNAFQKYAYFEGRSTRREYWSVQITYLFPTMFLIGTDYAIANVVGVIFLIVGFVPILALNVRRLHDHNRSGANLFLVWIPLLGALLLFVWSVTRGTKGSNNYGPDPLDPESKEGLLEYFCSNCNSQISNQASYCENCGSKFNGYCDQCGEKMIDGSKFCSGCGKTLISGT